MASPLTATLTMFSIQVGFPVAGILVADKMFQRIKRTRKFRYGLAITSFAFGGWYLSNYFTEKYLENVEITLDAEFDAERDMEKFTDALNSALKKRGILARCESSSYGGKRATIKLTGLEGLDYPHGENEAIEFARKTAYEKIAYPLDSVFVDFHRT